MLKLKNIFALAIAVCGLNACGFEPLYVERTSDNDMWYYNDQFNTDIVKEMAQIKIESVTDRIGQLIKNELIDLFNPQGAPENAKYFLKLEPVQSRTTQQALRDDITATREKVRYAVKYELWSKEKGHLVSGDAWVYLSYDLLDNPYSTVMNKKKIEKDGAKIIANDIALRIGAYFHSVKTNRGDPNEF